MFQNKAFVVLIGLAIGFIAGFILRPVIAPATGIGSQPPVAIAAEAPRSEQYFEAHIDEARHIISGCRDGSVRGGECSNAADAVTKVEARERTDRFLGKHP